MTGRRVLVFGSRLWGAYVAPDGSDLVPYRAGNPRPPEPGGEEFDLMFQVLDALHGRDPFDVVVTGSARGADQMAEWWALERGVDNERFPADWTRYHRAAGLIRNQRMLDEGQPGSAVGFHRAIKDSRGSADMFRRLSRYGIPTEIYGGPS